MAEEILYEWKHPSDLVLEVMGAIPDGGQPLLHALWSILADPSLVARHDFSLLNATGRRVEFPLKLVSDTHIVSAKKE